MIASLLYAAFPAGTGVGAQLLRADAGHAAQRRGLDRGALQHAGGRPDPRCRRGSGRGRCRCTSWCSSAPWPGGGPALGQHRQPRLDHPEPAARGRWGSPSAPSSPARSRCPRPKPRSWAAIAALADAATQRRSEPGNVARSW
ncbi:hypothetical protein L1887_51780 [Cichorium endivia]|nr:hypothetical protein L1887_51780 [Cichorium endivia]